MMENRLNQSIHSFQNVCILPGLKAPDSSNPILNCPLFNNLVEPLFILFLMLSGPASCAFQRTTRILFTLSWLGRLLVCFVNLNKLESFEKRELQLRNAPTRLICGQAGDIFLDSWLVKEWPCTVGSAIPVQVVLDAIRKQAGQAALPHGLCLSACLDFPQW